jgi:hypothetical protein
LSHSTSTTPNPEPPPTPPKLGGELKAPSLVKEGVGGGLGSGVVGKIEEWKKEEKPTHENLVSEISRQ